MQAEEIVHAVLNLADVKVLICGLPGALTHYIVDQCRAALASEYGECAVFNVNNMAPDTCDQITTSRAPVLLWADSPDRDTAAMAGRADFPICVLDVSFAETVVEFMCTRDVALVDALRVMALAKIGMWQVVENGEVHRVGTKGGLEGIIREIIDAAALRGPGVRGNSMAPTLPSQTALQAALTAHGIDEVHASAMTPQEVEAIAFYDVFYGHWRASSATRLDVPLCVLYSGVPPHRPNPEPTLDLVGPQRVLTFGPFAYLPEGHWDLHFQFTASENTPSNSVMLDVFADMEVKASINFELDKDGEFAYACEFDITDTWHTFEFRTHLRRGAIGGLLKLKSLRVSRKERVLDIAPKINLCHVQ